MKKDWDSFYREIADRLQFLGVSPADLVPCSESEVEIVEQAAGRGLPSAYASFLRIFGKGAGLLFDDVDIYFDSILRANREAKKVARLGHQPLPEAAFFFGTKHEDLFVFFDLADEGEDPPVYRLVPGRSGVDVGWPSFTAMVEQQIDVLESVHKRI